MQGAEANFLRTFDRKMKDLQFLLELVRKNNIGKQTTMKASPNEMVSKEREKTTILKPTQKEQFSRVM